MYLPLWKIWKSAGMMKFPIYGKIKKCSRPPIRNQTFKQPHIINSWLENWKPNIFFQGSHDAISIWWRHPWPIILGSLHLVSIPSDVYGISDDPSPVWIILPYLPQFMAHPVIFMACRSDVRTLADGPTGPGTSLCIKPSPWWDSWTLYLCWEMEYVIICYHEQGHIAGYCIVILCW